MSDTAVRKTLLGEGNTWVSVSLVLILIGFAFWMGALHTQVGEINTSVKELLKDHETRIRALEQKKP